MYFMAIADGAAEVKMKPSLGSILHSSPALMESHFYQAHHHGRDLYHNGGDTNIYQRWTDPCVFVGTGHGAGRLHCEGPQHVCRIRGRPEGHLQALVCVSHNDDGEEEQA